jgi:DNA-binding NtrC family response regulator
MRELANVTERTVALAEHGTIVAKDLCLPGAETCAAPLLETAIEQRLSLEELERAYVQRVMEEAPRLIM